MKKILISWTEIRKSRTGYLGSKKVERRQRRKWANRVLFEYGVKIVIVTPGSVVVNGADLYEYMIRTRKRAAFQSLTQSIYLLKGYTYFELAHEVYHAKHWHELGEKAYKQLTELQRETYVYEALMLERKKLTSAEVADAKSYINRLRVKFGKAPLP